MSNFFKKRQNIILFVCIVIALTILIWINFIYIKQCKDNLCFYNSLKKCSRASFISDGNMTLKYTIHGKSLKNCVVNVKLLDAGISNKDLKKIKDLEMNCYLPYQIIMAPESDISLCHGNLKEAFQDLIINKLHTYIVKNLGEINADLLKV